MIASRIKQTLSYLLLACGAILIFLGARTLWESAFGQNSAAREFEVQAASSSTSAISRGSDRDFVLRPVISPVIRRGETVAKLIIPRLETQLFVMEGDGDSELRRGPGHLADSARPGNRGNCIIAGHRDTHFRPLKDIRTGDDILVQTDDGQFLYRVNKTSVVSPSDTRALQPTRSAVLNLITCYPFYYVGSAPKRFVVEARLAGAVSFRERSDQVTGKAKSVE